MLALGIESSLELREVDSQCFASAWQPWLPPGAYGIYGGVLIAQCLVAAKKTVSLEFVANSMHCSFLIGGRQDIVITYRIERLPTTTKYLIRIVRAYQNDKCIFIASLSFSHIKETAQGSQMTEISALAAPITDHEKGVTGGGLSEECPYICSPVEIISTQDQRPERARTRQWVKTRDKIGQERGGELHAAALAYMTDNYLLATATRLRNILWTRDPELEKEGQIARNTSAPAATAALMVSLDHSIYFHNLKAFRADEWAMAEMETPWAGDGRALVLQRIYNQHGILIATALQEGVLRLEDSRSRL